MPLVAFAEADELRKQLRPLFHLDFDYDSYIVNLTPQSLLSSKGIKLETIPTLVYGDFRNGFQKTVLGQLQIGFGAQIRFWYDNIPGISKEHWSYVGVTPQVGLETESVRYAPTLQNPRLLGGVGEFLHRFQTWMLGMLEIQLLSRLEGEFFFLQWLVRDQ